MMTSDRVWEVIRTHKTLEGLRVTLALLVEVGVLDSFEVTGSMDGLECVGDEPDTPDTVAGYGRPFSSMKVRIKMAKTKAPNSPEHQALRLALKDYENDVFTGSTWALVRDVLKRGEESDQ